MKKGYLIAVLILANPIQADMLLTGVGGPTVAAAGGGSPLLTGIVSYWKLEESGTNNRIDELGTNTLTASAGMTNTASAIIGNGALFNGSSKLSVASNASIEFTTNFSVSLWIYQASIATNIAFINKWDYPTDASFTLQTSNTDAANLRLFVADSDLDGGSNIVDTSGANLSNGTWYHVVVVYDGTQTGNTNRAKIYVNGSDLTVNVLGTIVASINQSVAPLNFSSWEGASRFMGNGDRLDEIGVWSRSLTSAEVTQLYNGGAGLQYPF